VSGESNGRFTVSGLVNGVNYNVAVAAVDNFGNIGPLSTLTCQTPQPVNDFFKTYRMDGGNAGGGFCALDSVGMSHGSPVFAAGIAATLGAFFSRRRRARANANAKKTER
jgi:hypothetical protein